MRKKISKKYQIICRADTLSVHEIVKEVNVSYSFTYRVLRELKKLREKAEENLHNLPILSVPNYIKLRNEFNTEEELAAYFGVSRSTLHRFKVKHDITRLLKQYYALFSADSSDPTNLYNIASALMHVDAILSICEPDAVELPAVKSLIDCIRRSPSFFS